MENVSNLSKQALDLVIAYGPSLLMAIVTLLIGLWVIGLIGKFVGKLMERSKVDVSLQKFMRSLLVTLLKVMLFISVIDMLGVATTSFVAIIGAAGLAVGLALQGSLANFAGGVLILLLSHSKLVISLKHKDISAPLKKSRFSILCSKQATTKTLSFRTAPFQVAASPISLLNPNAASIWFLALATTTILKKPRKSYISSLMQTNGLTRIPHLLWWFRSLRTVRLISQFVSGATQPIIGASILTCRKRSSWNSTSRASPFRFRSEMCTCSRSQASKAIKLFPVFIKKRGGLSRFFYAHTYSFSGFQTPPHCTAR